MSSMSESSPMSTTTSFAPYPWNGVSMYATRAGVLPCQSHEMNSRARIVPLGITIFLVQLPFGFPIRGETPSRGT